MSPRIDVSIDELPEASSILDGHDYSSQIIQRVAGVPVMLEYRDALVAIGDVLKRLVIGDVLV